MLIDLLCTDNYMNYNIKVAHILGLQSAIYISAILKLQNIKVTDTQSKSIKVSRQELTDFTCLTVEDQISVEERLHLIGILDMRELDNNIIEILFDLEEFTKIFSSGSATYLGKLKKLSTEKPKPKKLSARQQSIIDFKNMVKNDNFELQNAYEDWIDGVYNNPNGFLSAKAINVFKYTLDKFAQDDLELKLKILEIAAVGGYRDCTWAINAFNKDHAAQWKKDHSAKPVAKSRKVNLGEEVF